MNFSHSLVEVPCDSQEGTGWGAHLGAREPRRLLCAQASTGLLPALPCAAAPGPCRTPGGSTGGAGAPDWNHMEAHLQ